MATHVQLGTMIILILVETTMTMTSKQMKLAAFVEEEFTLLSLMILKVLSLTFNASWIRGSTRQQTSTIAIRWRKGCTMSIHTGTCAGPILNLARIIIQSLIRMATHAHLGITITLLHVEAMILIFSKQMKLAAFVVEGPPFNLKMCHLLELEISASAQELLKASMMKMVLDNHALPTIKMMIGAMSVQSVKALHQQVVVDGKT